MGAFHIKELSSKKLMSLFIGKSNKSCNAVSDESSRSLELEESEFLHSKSSFTLLPGVEDPTGLEAKSVVMADIEPHLLEDEIGLWQLVM